MQVGNPALLAGAIQNPIEVSNGLVGYWSLNGVSGSVVKDFCGNANYTDGVIAGTAVSFSGGPVGGAFYANGTGAISVSDSPYLRPGSGDWTIAYWFWAPNTAINAVMVGKRNNGPSFVQLTTGLGGINSGGSGIVSKTVNIFQYSPLVSYNTTSDVIDGFWHHFVAIRPAAGTASIYIDGLIRPLTAQAAGGASNINNTDIWQFGGPNNGSYTNCALDDIRLYNRILTQGEITALYNMPIPLYAQNIPVLAWASQVIANGGPKPSQNTVTALDTFYTSISSSGVLSKMISVNCFAPDSLVASITPLIYVSGSSIWTSTGFVPTDLTNNGLKGDGSKYLDTGVLATTAYPNDLSSGLTLYNNFSDTSTAQDFGAQGAGGANEFSLYFNEGGKAYFPCWDEVTGMATGSALSTGYTSANRLSASSSSIYIANAVTPHAPIGIPITTTGGTRGGLTTTLFLFWLSGGLGGNKSKKQFSFAAIHTGLTITDSQNLYNAVVTMRTSLGGGVMPTSPVPTVQTWIGNVALNGGGYPAQNTITALETFYNTISSSNLLPKMVMVNCFVPDSLTACLVPLISVSGSSLWTNHSFVSGDLTVNGLTGNGSSKYLETGIQPSSLGSGNLGMVEYASSASPVGFDFGSFDSSHDFFIASKYNDNNSYFSSGDARAVVGVLVASSGSGFYSCQRTATAVMNSYFANAIVPFSQIGPTDTNSSPGYPTQPIYSMAVQQSVGGPSLYTSATISFQAITLGLNSSQTQTLYNAIMVLRTSLGGGVMPVSSVPAVQTWINNVSANGGNYPSKNTITAMETFYNTISSSNLLPQMLAVNCFVPDNLVACTTPLIATSGSTPWTNHNFVSGDLTVNGLTGNAGTPKYLDTGINPNSAYSNNNNSGLSVYVTLDVTETGCTLGSYDGASALLDIYTNYSGTTYYDAYYNGGSGRTTVSPSLGTGFYSANRVSSSDMRLFWGTGSNNNLLQQGATNSGASGPRPNATTYVFGLPNTSTYSSKRISFAAVHMGLTVSQASTLFQAAYTLRQNLGGGII